MEVIPNSSPSMAAAFRRWDLLGVKIHRGPHPGNTELSQNTFWVTILFRRFPCVNAHGITVAETRRSSSTMVRHPCSTAATEIVEVDPMTHNPQWYRHLNRYAGIRSIYHSGAAGLLALIWLKTLLSVQATVSPLVFFSVALPLYSLSLTVVMCLVVLSLKWILLGRTRAGHHPLWSCWCSRWDFLYVVWGAWARPVVRALEGTLFINAWLRLFGVRIGRRVFLGAGFGQVVDPDMLNFEDGATVINHFQAHSFEDRVLKTDPGTFVATRQSSHAIDVWSRYHGEPAWRAQRNHEERIP